MAENSKIEWTDHTFNPWMGCTKVSPACANCYAERDFDHRYKKVQWGPSGTRVVTSDANWQKPLQWNRTAESLGVRHRVFCASLADVFEDWDGPIHGNRGERMFWSHSRAPHESKWHWIGESETAGGEIPLSMGDLRTRLFDLIDRTPNLDWLLLTKRPDNVSLMWPIHPSGRNQEGMSFEDAHRRDNVWLGTSVENQEYADKRIPELLKCRDLSPVLFLSCEPLLGHLELCYPESHYPDGPRYCCDGRECGCYGLPCDPPAYLNRAFGGVDWVIAGGESGPNARPSNANWVRSLRDQCEGSSVPFHFKQWGEFNAAGQCVGKKVAGRVLDGVTHDGLPAVKQLKGVQR